MAKQPKPVRAWSYIIPGEGLMNAAWWCRPSAWNAGGWQPGHKVVRVTITPDPPKRANKKASLADRHARARTAEEFIKLTKKKARRR